MFKQIFALFLLIVTVNSQFQNSSMRIDDFNNLNRRQYDNNIKDYDLHMQTFKQNYAAYKNTIEIQLDMLLEGLIQNNEHLNPLEVLSDFSKQCVAKYRPLIPTADSVRATITMCFSTVINQVNTLMLSPLSTRNILKNYYTNTYEKEITNCNRTFGNLPLNHTICVTSVTTTTNIYTVANKKVFATQMDAAECSANAYIKKALDCSFSAQNRTISLIAEANTLINRCLQGLDNCQPCQQGFSCPNLHLMRQSQVDYRNMTMTNPFYGRNQTLDCLMLRLY